MAYCRFCGASIPEDARFCHRCGKSTLIPNYCPSCNALLLEDSLFCSACGAAVKAQTTSAPKQGRPPELYPQNRAPQKITIPAPKVAPAEPEKAVPLPKSAALEGVMIPAIACDRDFTGSVQRFYGENGSHYSFRGNGMYGFLEPYSMNYIAGQGPLSKEGGKWFYHESASAQGMEIPALDGAQILTSTPDGMYVYIAPTIYFVSKDGTMRPFMDAAETLLDMVCYRNWLFVTYLGPFEEAQDKKDATQYLDRSYVVIYDRITGDAAAILERCAGIYYIDRNMVILCDLMDSGEIRRNAYRLPVHGWTEEGFLRLTGYVGRIRGGLPFSKLILDTCGGKGNWKTPTECTANLRFCDLKNKRLAFQKKDTLIWRDLSGNAASGPQEI